MAEFFTTEIQNLKDATEIAKASTGNKFAKFPQYASGARAYIIVKGQPLAVCLNFNCQVTAQHEEIRTIDTQFPWDISVGQVSITATLSQIVDPKTSAESQAIFATMAASAHQPYVSLEVYDKLGERQFYAKGMFLSHGLTTSVGSLINRTINFVGVAYAHNVDQSFKPYSDNSTLDNFKSLSNDLSRASGKIFGKFGL